MVTDGPSDAWVSVVRCATVPGFGRAAAWQVIVSGVPSAVHTEAAMRYAAPVVTGFADPGALNAGTGGGQSVQLLGMHFGTVAHNALSGVSYGPNASAEGKYLPTGCSVVSDHTVVQCDTVPGVGGSQLWNVSIGLQATPMVVTSYNRPFISLVAGPGAANADTRGGQVVVLNGSNFGTVAESPASIDFVSYSSSTDVYRAAACAVVVDHVSIQCLTVPGAGVGLVWAVSIAGQVSPPWAGTTAYGAPAVFSTYVSTDATLSFPVVATNGLQTIVVNGLNFGPVGYLSAKLDGVPLPLLAYQGDTQFLVRPLRFPCCWAGANVCVRA